uniref:Protein trichome birefringence-like 34 n=1 Tax=Tanacetum cinerariifolium TaxID=118510 RepID=A0A699U4Q7_TANCI|nr:protein trichome birefringence-like 34 [Tanacetum cinerariifolium]
MQEAEIDDYSFEGCDLFNGSWIYDNVSRPLYKEKECSFMADDYSCEKFGRKDFKYQFWRWQPHGCDLPSLYVGLLAYLISALLDKPHT